jgi:hypothetical protein
MLDAADEARLQTLPADVAAPMREALRCLATAEPERPAFTRDAYPGLKIEQSPSASRDADAHVIAAFEAAGFAGHREPVPTPDALSEVQRTLVELVASRPGVALHRFALPQTAWARRRWLGIDPPSALEREVDGRPLYAALAGLDRDAATAVLDGLPPVDRLEAHALLALDPYRLRAPRFGDLGSIGDDAGAWAAGFADWLGTLFEDGAPPSERGGHGAPPRPVPWIVTLALVRGGVAIEPRWDWLLRVGRGPLAEPTHQVLAAIPEPRRSEAIARALGDEFAMHALRQGMELVREHPSPALVEHLIARADEAMQSLSCPPRREYLVGLADAVASQPELQARVLARLESLPPLPVLRTAQSRYVQSLDCLTPGQRTQLGILGQGWEGENGPLVTLEDDEPRFHGFDFVSVYTIVDEHGEPAYDALLYMNEDGAVCMADTTRSVAYVSQRCLSCNMGEALQEALHALLRVRPPSADDDPT